MKDLPVPIKVDSGFGSSPGGIAEDPMTIAWRYQNMRQVQSIPGSSNSGTQLGHNFDLTQTISPEDLDSCNYTLWSGPEENDLSIGMPLEHFSSFFSHVWPIFREINLCFFPGNFINPNYGFLLARIQKHIMEGQFLAHEPSKKNILRLGIHSLGSPLWVDSVSGESMDAAIKKDLPRFLLYLRSLLRESYALAVVTVPCHLFQVIFSNLKLFFCCCFFLICTYFRLTHVY